MDNGYSLSDVASVIGNNGFGNGNEGMWMFALLILLFANGGWNGNGGDYGRFATAASQQEILFGQQFNNIDNKIDRLANGLCDSTYALNNAITSEGRSLQTQLADSTQKILDNMAQSKIESLQAKVNQLEMQNMMCGTPKISPYLYNVHQNCGCDCGNI